jgi:DNA-binding SARP family transcriptional activator
VLYLACQPAGGAPRERVVEALWPDDLDGEEAVAHRLRQMRFRLRHVLGSVPGAPAMDAIVYDRSEVTLLLDPAVVYSDAREFLDVVHTARSRVGFDTIPLLERARALYTGDLLDGPAVRKYAWLDERDDSGVTLREHFRRLFQQTTGSLADLYAAQGRNEEAIDVYRDLTELDPGEDRAWQQLFRLHALRKDRPALLREERRMRQMLRELATDEDGPTSPAMLEPGRETVREFNRALAQLDEQERGEAVIAS